MKNRFFLLLTAFFLNACSDTPSYDISEWNMLIDPNFNQEKVVQFYKERVSKTKEGSKEEILIYAELQDALKKAGNNKDVDGKRVKFEGYIVPVDTDAQKVNKFLFFPNQAACVHVPSSPANQTIYVTTIKDEGVRMEDAYEKILVYGTLKLMSVNVATGVASFVIEDGITSLTTKNIWNNK
jgi:hypothetical protein